MPVQQIETTHSPHYAQRRWTANLRALARQNKRHRLFEVLQPVGFCWPGRPSPFGGRPFGARIVTPFISSK
jgi:hypothetical protein